MTVCSSHFSGDEFYLLKQALRTLCVIVCPMMRFDYKFLKIIVHKLINMPPHPSLSPLGRGLR